MRILRTGNGIGIERGVRLAAARLPKVLLFTTEVRAGQLLGVRGPVTALAHRGLTPQRWHSTPRGLRRRNQPMRRQVGALHTWFVIRFGRV